MEIFNADGRRAFAKREAIKALEILCHELGEAKRFVNDERGLPYLETKALHSALADYAINFAIFDTLR